MAAPRGDRAIERVIEIETFSLSLHASWRCRHSGACCSSNWAIDVDASRAARIDAAVHDGVIALSHDAASFETRSDSDAANADAAHAAHPILLGRTSHGACVFHDAEARRCRVHTALGHGALPLACRQFPRVALIDARGVRISLSHYCPSAVARLFDDDAPLTIVRGPESFPADAEYDGLDARHAFPPLLRPGVLMDWNTVDALEQFGVTVFAAEMVSPEAALARFADGCETLRSWRVEDGSMIDRVRTITDRASGGDMPASYQQHAFALDWGGILMRDAEVRAADPNNHQAAPEIEAAALVESYHTHAGPVWPAFTRPICRYLAARLFGSWCWYQGQGLRSLVRSLDAALSVLRIECARQTWESSRMLDRDALRQAIRQTDLRLLHLASRETLAERWSVAERD